MNNWCHMLVSYHTKAHGWKRCAELYHQPPPTFSLWRLGFFLNERLEKYVCSDVEILTWIIFPICCLPGLTLQGNVMGHIEGYEQTTCMIWYMVWYLVFWLKGMLEKTASVLSSFMLKLLWFDNLYGYSAKQTEFSSTSKCFFLVRKTEFSETAFQSEDF